MGMRKKRDHEGYEKTCSCMTFLFMLRLKLPLCCLGLTCALKNCGSCTLPLRFNSTNEIISAFLASLPLHNTKMPISLSSRSLTFFLFSVSPLSPTHIHTQQLVQEIHYMLPSSVSHGHLNTYYRHTCDGHMHTNRPRKCERERPQTPKQY